MNFWEIFSLFSYRNGARVLSEKKTNLGIDFCAKKR